MAVVYAVVPAAGRGLRMGGDRPKQFLELRGRPILDHTLEGLARVPFLSGIQLVVPGEYVAAVRDWLEQGSASAPLRSRLPAHLAVEVVPGGKERQDSVSNGLSRLPGACDWVLIHDGVRPFASVELFERTWAAARQCGAAIAALPSTDTVKRVDGGHVAETLRRESIWLVQTPQIFRRDILTRAYESAREAGWIGTDDASLVERLSIPVAVALGERTNIKVTTPDDLDWGEQFLRRVRGPA